MQINTEEAFDASGGTSLQGYVEAAYDDLVRVFGPPDEGDGVKVDAEWALLSEDGSVATIYNYKDGVNYLGADEGTPVEDITEWHIGGHSPSANVLVRGALRGDS